MAGSDNTPLTPTVGESSTADGAGAMPVRPIEHTPPLGSALGPFVLRQRVGSGGMGVVFAAHDPILDRKVAIKVLRPDLFGASHTRRARLLREAQALARLSHPNVVTVYQAGVHDEQVFLAMEFVSGRTLTEWLREPRTPRDIVAAFVAAGRGLAAAHGAGMVHRDFKPDNVLVGDDGRVRVTDFGLVGVVAEAVSDDGTRTPDSPSASPLGEQITHAGTLLGTPRYMALEQHRGSTVDARADQFAFAVALYEALYHRPPFAGRTPGELQRSLETGPAPAGDRAQHVPRWLLPIVLRGLRPRAAERFRSMDEMLAALEKGPPRFWRRAAVVLGVAGVGAAAFLALRPTPCRGAGDRLAGVWDAPTRSRIEKAFLATGAPTAREAFDRAAAALDRYAASWVTMRTQTCQATSRGEQSPALQDLRMSCLDQRLGQLQSLTAVLGEADGGVIRRAAPAALGLERLDACADAASLAGTPALPEDPARRAAVVAVQNRRAQAAMLNNVGRVAPARTEITAAVADARQLDYRPLVAETLVTLGRVIQDTDPKAAQAALEEAIAVGSEVKADRLVAEAHMELMWVVGVKQSRRQEALAMRPLADAAIRRAGASGIMRERLLHNVGRILVYDGKYDEAAEALTESAELAERALGKDHPDVARSLRQLAVARERQGRYDEARKLVERALPIFERQFGSQSLEYAAGVSELGNLAWFAGDLDTARRHFEQTIAIFEAANQGQPTSDLAGIYHNLGLMLHEQGRYDEARPYYDKALAAMEKVLGPDHPRVAQTLFSLGELEDDQGHRSLALSLMRRALAIQEKRLPPDHPDIAFVLAGLGSAVADGGDLEEGAALVGRALAIQEKKPGPDHPDTAKTRISLGEIKLEQGRAAEAAGLLERAMKNLAEPANAVPHAKAEFALARAYGALRRNRAEAVAMAKDARAILGAPGVRVSRKTLDEIDAWLAKR